MNSPSEPVAARGAARKPRSNSGRGPGRPTLSNEELLDKALDIFLEKGFERTSIDAITAAAGMAKRTVYLRYGDKTALFKAALERAIEEWIVPVETLRAAETDDLEETLLRIGHILVANLMTPSGLRLLRITNAEAGRMPEIGVYTYRYGTERTIAYLADLFRRRLSPAGGDLPEAEDAALGFLHLVVSGPPTMTAWGLHLDEAAVERQTRYAVGLFLHGLKPREAGTSGAAAAVGADAARVADLARAVRALEDENRRLRRLLVDSMLEISTLKDHATGG
jgi:AcrR family transcriptional regulator